MLKKILFGIVCLLLCVGCSSDKEISLTFKDIKKVEYGTKFDTKSLIKRVNGKIKDYPVLDTMTLGEHKLVFDVTKGEEKKSFEYIVEVKDTKKPTIHLKNTFIEIKENTTFDPLSYVKSVKDKIDGDLVYKKESDIKDTDKMYYTYQSDVNIKKAGKYTVVFKATDKNGNTATKKLTVNVYDKQEAAQRESDDVLLKTMQKMKVSKTHKKVVIVSSSEKSSSKAVLQYFEKTRDGWEEKMNINCEIGRFGMGTAQEGNQKTPIGKYRFEHAYGLNYKPANTRLPYTQVNRRDYWCHEEYYNQYVNESRKNHSQCSKKKDESFKTSKSGFEYFMTFNYNPNNKPSEGTGYFLKCKTNATNSGKGSICINESHMKQLLEYVDDQTVIIIDQLSQMSKY